MDDDPGRDQHERHARRAETVEQRLQRTGIVRVGSPRRGFRYRRADGSRPSAPDRARIAALVIPPAWRDVRIAPSPNDRVQAIGRDQRGRLQYRYHAQQAEQRERDKLERILRFAAALPRLRVRVDRDLRRSGLCRERVMAAIVRILGACLLRPGSAAYARDNGSHGVATLRRRHVRVVGDTVRFEYPGKSGKHQRHELRDARVARVVRELMPLRTPELFVFEASRRSASARGRGRMSRAFVDVRRRDVNAYLAEAAGERISAKDFRTWAGTLVCASLLANARGCDGAVTAGGRRAVAAALSATAGVLGNTPAVCRKSYVFGAIFDAYARGETVGAGVTAIGTLVARGDSRLQRLERAVARLLVGARPAARRRAG
jgi:DNA topoisomerase-1